MVSESTSSSSVTTRSRSRERTAAATVPENLVKLPPGRIPVFVYLLSVVAVGTAIPVYLHFQLHKVFNIHQAIQAFFLWLNTNIAYWEMCLFFRRELVERIWKRNTVPYKGRAMYRAAEIMMYKVSPTALFYPSLWADVWAMYSLMDPSYSDKKSFGFWIDVGNGFSTLLPCLAIIASMTYDIFAARTLGIMLLLFSYQMWYGTVVYASSYVLNKRYEGHTKFDVGLFVAFTNGFWATIPMHGMWVAFHLIYSNTFAVFGVV